MQIPRSKLLMSFQGYLSQAIMLIDAKNIMLIPLSVALFVPYDMCL